MNELIDRVDNLKNTLNDLDEVKYLNVLKKKVMENEELLNDVKYYHSNPNEFLKEKIISNKLFREYKHQETEINLIIMSINQRLKDIYDESKGCI